MYVIASLRSNLYTSAILKQVQHDSTCVTLNLFQGHIKKSNHASVTSKRTSYEQYGVQRESEGLSVGRKGGEPVAIRYAVAH